MHVFRGLRISGPDSSIRLFWRTIESPSTEPRPDNERKAAAIFHPLIQEKNVQCMARNRRQTQSERFTVVSRSPFGNKPAVRVTRFVPRQQEWYYLQAWLPLIIRFDPLDLVKQETLLPSVFV